MRERARRRWVSERFREGESIDGESAEAEKKRDREGVRVGEEVFISPIGGHSLAADSPSIGN